MIKHHTDYSLLPHNTFGIDVKAAHFVEFSSVEDIKSIAGKLCDTRHLVIGGGSNLLFMGDFDGIILHSAIKGIEVVAEDDDSLLVRAGSGINWDEFVAYTVEQGWQGLENLSAIPGEVGASAVQNVGAYGVEAGDLIQSVECVSLSDGSERIFTKEQCRFAYRHSIFKAEEKGKYIVAYVTYRLNKKGKFVLTYGNLKEQCEALGGVNAANIRRAVCETRAAKLPDPAEIGSAGSFFMNPVVEASVAEGLKSEYPSMPTYPAPGGIKLSAGWLIDQCGWKQRSSETVGVYSKQALVVVNLGGATGKDVIEFARQIQASVKEKFGVEIFPEVNVIE
jgi:UDP-N-acetylmuramate dehydrogenase